MILDPVTSRMSQIEREVSLLGVSGIEDRLQENVKETIQVGFCYSMNS